MGASRLPGDDERLAEAVSARLWLTFHHGCRAWKGFDCESLCRLHAKGPSADPVGRAKSVVLAWCSLGKACADPKRCSPATIERFAPAAERRAAGRKTKVRHNQRLKP